MLDAHWFQHPGDVSWGARFVDDSQSRQQKRRVFLAGTKGHEQKK